jgi:aminopeptidase N
VLHVTAAAQSFCFDDVAVPPVPSLLRGFSAPVTLEFDYPREALALLAAHDSDPYCRWDAAQRSFAHAMLDASRQHAQRRPLALDPAAVAVARQLLADGGTDPALRALALAPPEFAYLASRVDAIDIDALAAARAFVTGELARALREPLSRLHADLRAAGPYAYTPAQAGARALANRCLAYLCAADDAAARALAVAQYDAADNMTDAIAALAAVAHSAGPEREALFARFEAKWRDEPLVLDKWFALQATSRRADTLARVRMLLSHPKFNARNPNRVRSLVGAFALSNWPVFHAADGSGYAFVADQVLALDRVNPHVSSMLAGAFARWRRFPEPRRSLQRAALARIAALRSLSADAREIVASSLDG